MSEDRYKALKYCIKAAFFVFILVCIFFGTVNVSYALKNQEKPDMIITIDNKGNISYKGSLFGESLWYPGFEKSGVIRINNNYKKIKISNLGLGVEIRKYQTNYDKDMIYDSFIKNMKLTISIGRLLVFKNTILSHKSIGSLLYKPNDNILKGYLLKDSDQFTIDEGGSTDLKYKLTMDMESGEELENITADVDFLINIK